MFQLLHCMHRSDKSIGPRFPDTTGERKIQTNRWKMKFNYRILEAVRLTECRESRSTEHVSRYEQCSNAQNVSGKSWGYKNSRLSAVSGLCTPTNQLGTSLNPHVVGEADNGRVFYKEGKPVDGFAGTADAFENWHGLSYEEKARVGFALLRYRQLVTPALGYRCNEALE